MGTKSDPGKYDCYAKAKPDEPMFVLLARDKDAHRLVRIWAHIKDNNLIDALDEFNSLVQNADWMNSINPEKKQEALNCADTMEHYEPE